MRVTGTHSHGGIEPEGGDKHVTHQSDAAPAAKAGGKTSTSQSDPTGLGWRAKLSGQHAAAPAGGALTGAALTKAAQEAYDKAGENNDLSSLPTASKSELPAAAQKQLAKDNKDWAPDYPDQVYKLHAGGQTLYVLQNDNDGGSFATIYDKGGNVVASGSCGESTDWTWDSVKPKSTSSTSSTTTKPAAGGVTEKAVQKAYDDQLFGATVDPKDLPKAAQKQFAADSKASKADGYETSISKATVNGQTIFAVGKEDSDTGDCHVNFYDASGKLVASGGATERDGEYWNKI